jgi:hypothetical protein
MYVAKNSGGNRVYMNIPWPHINLKCQILKSKIFDIWAWFEIWALTFNIR